MKKVLSMVLAGGKGERLYPLTRDRAKPAVPFGGTYRIIDFTISNCVNSGYRRIYVLTQYKSLSLDRHIQRAWNFLYNRVGEFVYIIHAQQRINETWYKGTADAIYQNFYTLQQERPDLVLVLSGDHIYKMDYRDMVNFHLRKKADLTIGTLELSKSESKHFGVLQTDNDHRVFGFQEKPAKPITVPGDPDSILINMGIYVFNTDVLVKRLIENAKKAEGQTEHDFGKNIIPSMLKSNRVFAFPFMDKKTKKPGYWKDVGTIDAYYEASTDLLDDKPGLNLFDSSWQIYTYEKQAPPAKVCGQSRSGNPKGGQVVSSILSRGCLVNGAYVEHSILSPNVSVTMDSEIKDSIILDQTQIGKKCRIQNAIIDKAVRVPDGTDIGFDLKHDAKRFEVTDSGLVIIPRNWAL